MAKREILVDGVPIDWGAQRSVPRPGSGDGKWFIHTLPSDDPACKIMADCAKKLGVTSECLLTIFRDAEAPDIDRGILSEVIVDDKPILLVVLSEGFFLKIDDEKLRALFGHELRHSFEDDTTIQCRNFLRKVETDYGENAVPWGLYASDPVTASGVSSELERDILSSQRNIENFRHVIEVAHGAEFRGDFAGARLSSSSTMQEVIDIISDNYEKDPDILGLFHPSDNERRVALMAREWALSNQGQVTEETEAEIIEDVLGSR